MKNGLAIAVAAAFTVCLVLGACSSTPEATSIEPAATPTPQTVRECEPSDTDLEPTTDEDRGEALVRFITGVDEQAQPEGSEALQAPNYAGVWGDFQGGWVVALVDCNEADLDEIARIAGGRDFVTILEVEHSYEDINGFRDELAGQLQSNQIPGDVRIDSTPTGRIIIVRVEDRDALPAAFGSGIPTGIFVVEQGPTAQPAGE